MTTELAQKLEGVRDFKRILETVVKELGETYAADLSQIVLSNPLDRNITSICEYKLYPEVNPNDLPVSMSFPLPVEGPGLGTLTLARRNEFHENEVNWIRITIAELCDIMRHAQINDVVQRDTFRNTFLFEIQSLMQSSLGLGDALFMVVNILGKVLQASRCLFVCVDDTQAGWKVYEFWQRERIQSCQDYGWPTTDSPIVARSLLTTAPLEVQEANQNSYLTPVQEELQLLNVRSLLGVPLRSDSATHGCIIVQHCESRHAWTRGEIDMIQNVADTVAEALNKLPAEKRAQEPIMRLHQREVAVADNEKESILAVRRALRGALGNTSIPSAQKSGLPKPVKEPPNTAAATQLAETAIESKTMQPATATDAEPQTARDSTMHKLANAIANQSATKAPDQSATGDASPALSDFNQNRYAEQSAATDSALKAFDDASRNLEQQPPLSGITQPHYSQSALDAIPTPGVDPDLIRLGKPPATPAQTPTAINNPVPNVIWQQSDAIDTSAATTAPQVTESKWGNLDAIGSPGASATPPRTDLDAIGTAATPAVQSGTESQWGNLDAIGTPTPESAAAADPQWGSLDSIPTPAAGPEKRGLSASMLGRRGAAGMQSSPLLASLHRDKSKFQQEQIEFVDGGTINIDEQQAAEKLKQVLATTNPSSDYIFATPGLDTRLLGRIDSWVSEIEEKDKYTTPHAVQVAEYSLACARLLGLPQKELDTIRLAAIVHDVGKLGLPAQILQKREAELSDQELLLIMKHPIDGANLLEGFPELAHLAPIVLAHHEEYNGNGYPAGLAGDKIPLAARLIHVASDYHHMTSPTRSEQPKTPGEAQQTMLGMSGEVYDPALVQVLIACVQQGLVGASR